MSDSYASLTLDLMEQIRDTDNALRNVINLVIDGNFNSALVLLGKTSEYVRLGRNAFERRVTDLEGGEE